MTPPTVAASPEAGHQLLLREVFLEFAADAVLRRRDV